MFHPMFWYYYLFGESALDVKVIEIDSCIFLVASRNACTQRVVEIDSCI